MPSPIRIGLIGLSQLAKTSWASQAHLPYLHLPYLLSERGRQRYKIVTLLNSSADAARRAIVDCDLGEEVKAYGLPGDLAADPDVDLVPSIAAGKAVFVEWPLAENVRRASELAGLAAKKGGRTMVDLQGRVAPAVLKVKGLLQARTIGKVLRSEVKAVAPWGSRDSISEGLAYFVDKKVGGNPVTIAFAHNPASQLHHQQPNDEHHPNHHLRGLGPGLLHGTLHPCPTVVEGASLLLTFRAGPPFPRSSPFTWTLNGERGELRVSSARGPFLQSEAVEMLIEVHDHATDEVKEVEWGWEEWQEPLLAGGRALGKLYDLFYEGEAPMGEFGVVDYGAAVERHLEIDALLC